MPDGNGITAGKITMPKGGGAIRGIGETFQPNPFSGTASFSIPIETSPCRGFEPQLSINYNSGSGNGPFGIGFGISIPNISRKTDKGYPKYDDTDTFLLSNADDLVPSLKKQGDGGWVTDTESASEGDISYTLTRYRPRVEGLFARIEKWVANNGAKDTHWRVTTGDNITSVYGRSSGARISDPDDAARVFQWLLEESRDAKGNRIAYEYAPERPANVAMDINESARRRDANKYFTKIKYGHYRDEANGDQWHFEVIFDYGERAPGELVYATPGSDSWSAREDPFSSYKSGFEIRTHRLCRQILMFHRFDGDPFLVGATQLSYRETPTMAFLTSARHIGYRGTEAEGYDQKEMPPIDLSYSSWDGPPRAAEFKPLAFDGGFGGKARSISRFGYQMIDLYGEGIPGVLYNDKGALLYWHAKGNAQYADAIVPDPFPIERNGGSAKLMDLGGDGTLDYMVATPNRAGCYESQMDGRWSEYRHFLSTTTDLLNPAGEMVDVTGDGLADILLIESDAVKFYPSLGKDGFGAAVRQRRDRELPITGNQSPTEIIRYADVFGDGVSHLVRIRNGVVEAWPNLGYGRFGDKVTFRDAPRFDGSLDPARLFLADIDGSGTADIIYAYNDRIDIYYNQSGNAFSSDPVSVTLPRRFDNIGQIAFEDVIGNGTASLVVSSQNADLSFSHEYCDFTGGIKPYLLTAIDANMGAVTQVEYTTSTKLYLADKEAGTPWTTSLPFPVQVIEKVTVSDHISNSTLVSCYRYHDGYYDADEREFRGFGFVERWDTEVFDPDPASREDDIHVPPVYTKTWYHTGAYLKEGVISNHYLAEYYKKDDRALLLPDSVLEPDLAASDGATIREAYRALHGSVLREEVYGLDTDRNPDLAAHPYGVTEANSCVRLVQPKAGNEHCVCFVYHRESIDYDYERDPTDPRISHEFTIDVDAYGHVVKSCEIFYPRRALTSGSGDPGDRYYAAEQGALRMTASCDGFINETESSYLLGIPYEERDFEVGGFALDGADYAAFDRVSAHLDGALGNPIAFDAPLDGTSAQARLLSWHRHYYWNDDGSDALPLGRIAGPGLLHHSESAEFSQTLIETAFAGRLTAEMLDSAALSGRPAAPPLLQNRGQRHAEDGEEVTPPLGKKKAPRPLGKIVSLLKTLIADISAVFAKLWNREKPQKPADSPPVLRAPAKPNILYAGRQADTERGSVGGGYQFDRGYWWNPGLVQWYYGRDSYYLPSKTTDVFGAETTVGYDEYCLTPVSLQDALGNCTRAEIDYVTLGPSKMTDMNDNISEACFDPLGTVIATSVYGTEGDRSAGDADLAQYRVVADATSQDILAGQDDPREKYLQQATSYFFYDLCSWINERQPVHHISLLRETHVADLDPGGETGIQVHISYYDGFGRTVQHKTKADPGPAYLRDNDGELSRDGEGNLALADCAGRWLTSGRTVYNNKGYPVKQYEPFYSATSAYEPETELTEYGVSDVLSYDPLLRLVRVDTPKGFYSQVEFSAWVERHFDENDTVKNSTFYRANSANADPAFADELDALQKAADHHHTPAIQVLDNMGHPFLSVQTTEDGDFLISKSELDIQGNILTRTDPRLLETNDSEGTAYRNFAYVYDMGGGVLRTVSADAGAHCALNNAVGNPIHAWDSRGFHRITSYDLLHRPVQLYVEGGDGDEALAHVVEQWAYGEGEPNDKANNLRGKPVRLYDQGGKMTIELYALSGQIRTSKRQLLAAYAAAADWDDPDIALEAGAYATDHTFDALGRVVTARPPDGSVLAPSYLPQGWLGGLAVSLALTDGDGVLRTKDLAVVGDVNYNARGQRTDITYGNGVSTTYGYEAETFRLTGLRSTASVPNDLQDIAYTYDPVGNITRIEDATADRVFSAQGDIDTRLDYTYDALYRLVQATGRAHSALTGDEYKSDASDVCKQSRYLSFDGESVLEGYREHYSYDQGGNMTGVDHQVSGVSRWSRTMVVSAASNRAVLDDRASGPGEVDALFDGNGNLASLDHIPAVRWNYHNNVGSIDMIQRDDGLPSDREYYVYDLGGQRIRKVTETLMSDGVTVQILDVIYLGHVEHKRIKQRGADGSERVLSDTWTSRIMDDQRCVATAYGSTSTEDYELRYHLDNHLGSVALEVGDDGTKLTYEEYFPYGGTAFVAAAAKDDLASKKYRYSDKERDDASSLYYYGARYLAPWAGRWLSPDPAGTVDGLNLYAFVVGNPVTHVDLGGMMYGAILHNSRRRRYPHSPRLIARRHKERKERKERGDEDSSLRINSTERQTRVAGNAKRAARGVAVGESSKKEKEIADSHPGSYAASLVLNRGWNQVVMDSGGGSRMVADHATTDWSQRGSIKRSALGNQDHTLMRPAFRVLEHLHDAHPTTKYGHGFHTVAYEERRLQLNSRSYSLGRYHATKLHMSKYYEMYAWRNMAKKAKDVTRISFENMLDQPAILRLNNGDVIDDVHFTSQQKKWLMKSFDNSFISRKRTASSPPRPKKKRARR